MEGDDNLPSASVEPGQSAGPLSPGCEDAVVLAAAAAAVPRPVLGIPPDMDFGGDHERCTMFEPALYIQRYTTVCQLLADSERFGVVSKVRTVHRSGTPGVTVDLLSCYTETTVWKTLSGRYRPIWS